MSSVEKHSGSSVPPVIMLRSGVMMHTVHPNRSHIYINDIAQGLSLSCRWGGQCMTFYSVAQHSVLLYDVMRRDFPDEAEWALWALLHDASEAYIGDVPRPFKQFMPDFMAMEKKLLKVIAHRFGISEEIPVEVLRADHNIIRDEFLALYPDRETGWMKGEGFQGVGVVVSPWSWQDAYRAWLLAMKNALERCGKAHFWQEDGE